MIRKTIKGGDFKPQMVGELEFDQVPEEGSFNPVTSDAIAKALSGVHDDVDGVIGNIAPDYDDITFPVTSGTFCMHEFVMYYANTDIASSEDWTAAHWTQTNVAEQIGNEETLLAAL